MTFPRFLVLSLAACDLGLAPPTAPLPDLALAVPYGTLVFSGPAEVPAGETAAYVVSGAHPGETVFLTRSINGPGAGPCITALGGQCLSLFAPVRLATGAAADALGTVTFLLPVGELPVGSSPGLQALTIRGLHGVDSLLSNAVGSEVVPRVEGCVDPEALNLDPNANVDDGTCAYAVDSDTDGDSGGLGVAPQVIATNLGASATAVATNRAITATFDLPMNATSVVAHFVVSPDVPSASPTFDSARNRVVFAPAPLAPGLGLGPATPTAFLLPSTTYTVTLLAGAEDTLGVPLAEDYQWSFTTGVEVNELAPELGPVTPVVMLGATVVGTGPPTVVTGDVASIGALSGFSDLSTQVLGLVYSPASVPVPVGVLSAFDVVLADLRGRDTASILPFSAPLATVGPLSPGLYVSAPAVALASDVVLDAGNDVDATFIFRVTGALSLAAGVQVTLEGGADPANVFWLSDGAIVLGAGASLVGTVLTPAAVTLGADASVYGGRLLSGDAALTLGAANTVSLP